MRITPLDIKKQEFQTRMRGFDRAEVISFLEMVSEEMEELVKISKSKRSFNALQIN